MSTNLVSPIAGSVSTELFSRALAELDVDKMARDAGVMDLPASDSQAPDANERQIIGYFSTKIREEQGRCISVLAKLALDRSATSSKIDIIQTRSSLSALFNAIEPDLVRKRQDHQQDLERAKGQEGTSLRYLRYFKKEHGLGDRAVDPRPDPLMHFAVVAVFAVIEWISLSIFYAEGSDFGLLGGIIMAMALSLINIGLAVFAGAVLRYINHKSLNRRILAIVGVSLLTLLFLFATGFAAHYRNAAIELAKAGDQQQHPTTQIVPAKSAKPGLPPSGSEDDQWKASKLAWENSRKHGFMFTDVLSWLLVILSIMFGIVASWKGYGIDDRYPGYGPTSRRYEEHTAAYESEKKKYTEAVDGVFIKAGLKQQELLQNVRRDIEYFQDLASKSEQEVSKYESFASQVWQTCNDVIFRYREVNRGVATSPKPAYFEKPVHLDQNLTTLPEPLSIRERALLKEYEAAIREFTKVVQEDDTRRQALRTIYLNNLAAFFDQIELAINEKLARETRALAA